MKKIIIFASGSGSNAERIATYFQQKGTAQVSLILCNNPQAGVLTRAKRLAIPSLVFNRQAFYESDIVLNVLKSQHPDLIVLAGFLWKVPAYLTEAYPHKIINIHPSLIPSFCGKGYYGIHVHEAALKRGVKITGATVHYVDEDLDTGPIILQKAVEVREEDTPQILQKRVMEEAEHIILPEAINMIAAALKKQEEV